MRSLGVLRAEYGLLYGVLAVGGTVTAAAASLTSLHGYTLGQGRGGASA